MARRPANDGALTRFVAARNAMDGACRRPAGLGGFDRREHRAAAIGRAATAGVVRGRRAVIRCQAVVDEQFVPCIHRDDRLELQEQLACVVVLLDRLAVRVAGVIQVTSAIAPFGAIDGFMIGQGEQVSELVIPDPRGDFLLRVAPAFIQTQQCESGQGARRKGAEAVNTARRHPDKRGGRCVIARLCHANRNCRWSPNLAETAIEL